MVHTMYQFRHICTSGGSGDDAFRFSDPRFLFVFCSNYDPISLRVAAIGDYVIGQGLVHTGI